jgi:hypothetical protein
MQGSDRVCDKCGTPNPASHGFCHRCGAALPELGPARCGRCGTEIGDQDFAFCPKCGVPLEKPGQPLIPDPADDVASAGPKVAALGVYSDASSPASSRQESTRDPKVPESWGGRTEDPSSSQSHRTSKNWIQRREPRVAYAIGIGVGVGLIILLAVILPIGSALEAINLDPRSPAPLFGNVSLSAVIINITYANSSDKWLGPKVQDECLMITCPVEFQSTSRGGLGDLIIWLFSNSSKELNFYTISSLKWTPTYVPPTGGVSSSEPESCTAISVGYSECPIALQVPPPTGPYSLTVNISA